MKQKKRASVPVKQPKKKGVKQPKPVVKQKISKNVLIGIAILFIMLFVIVVFSSQQQIFRGNAATQISPTYGTLGDCQTNGTCPTNGPSGSTVSPTTQAPCVSTQNVSIMRHRNGKGRGNENFTQQLLQFLQQILQLLQQLLGVGTTTQPPVVTLPSGQPQPSGTQPSQAAPSPSGTNPSAAPCPPTNAPQPTGPQQQPTGTPTGLGTTATTCTGNGTGGSVSLSGYTLVNCEDFNETSLPSGWSAYNENGSAGSTTVGIGRTPSQCSVGNGVVSLTQTSNGATCGMSSSFGQKYGLWEARMRAYTTGSGNGSPPHPVLILWPDSNAWPTGGEYDYAEANIGSQMQAFFHCATSSGGNCATASSSVDFSQWHNYAIKWTATSVTGYIDGQQWITTTNANAMAPGSMHQTIQLDNLSGSTPVDPGVMQVDWVHVYK